MAHSLSKNTTFRKRFEANSQVTYPNVRTSSLFVYTSILAQKKQESIVIACP